MSTTTRVEIYDRYQLKATESLKDSFNEQYGLSLNSLARFQYALVESKDENFSSWFRESGKEVISDSLLQNTYWEEHLDDDENTWVAEIGFRPGVTDNSAHSMEEAFAVCDKAVHCATGTFFVFKGSLTKEALETIVKDHLGNDLIQSCWVGTSQEFKKRDRFNDAALPKVTLAHGDKPQVEQIDLNSFDDDGLNQLSVDRCLALRLDEIEFIRDFFNDEKNKGMRAELGLPANPTDVELEVLAQTWSEHCKHKIFSAKIDYTETKGDWTRIGDTEVDGLYKQYVKAATKEVEKENEIPWLISVFSDNAGIVRFDPNIDVCIKVETHNSPSALDPYGGALTGILGVNRDILGCGLGARPVANMDVFCFAPPHWPPQGLEGNLPSGVKAPRQVLTGVHKGVEDGGNKSGIPTVNGAFFFDNNYAGKPLVFVGTVGVLPQKLNDGRDGSEKKVNVGDRIFMVGGRVGADGIHGATFSSLEIDENAPATAVQIGDPLTQKRVGDFIISARDKGLYSCITDNGAGGLSSSVGEMATYTNGASLDLKKCPVKYPGLTPYELMISESQERMTVAVPAANAAEFIKLATSFGVEASDLGEFTDDGYLQVFYGDDRVGHLDLHFMHEALPQMELKAHWDGPRSREDWMNEPKKEVENDMSTLLLELLANPNICSKEPWVRKYDHEVQAATHIKPFGGDEDAGANNAGVIWAHPHGGDKDNGFAIGAGMAPRISLHDPYVMAQTAVDEAVRNIVVHGANPEMICLLDNFCWPDPVESEKTPDGQYKLGQLVRASKGLYDVCKAYGMPLVSGKDSMKNDFKGKSRSGKKLQVSILPTLLVTSMGAITPSKSITPEMKNSGDDLYLLGKTQFGMAGSTVLEHTSSIDKAWDKKLSDVTLSDNITLYKKLHEAIQMGVVESAHDVGEGGLLVSLAEKCIGSNGLGIDIDLGDDSVNALVRAFNENPGQIVVSVKPANREDFLSTIPAGLVKCIGKVTDSDKLEVYSGATKHCEVAKADLKNAWKCSF